MVSKHFLMEHVYMWVRYGFLHSTIQQQEQTLEASFHLVNNIFYAKIGLDRKVFDQLELFVAYQR